MRNKIFGLNLLILSLFIVDRAIKIYFLKNPGLSRDFISGWLGFRLASNPGIAFGILFNRIFIVILTIIIVIVLIDTLLKAYRQKKVSLIFSLSLIIAGASSNLADRLRYGYVVDYIDVPWFTVFNLADGMITVGIGLILIRELFFRKQKQIN